MSYPPGPGGWYVFFGQIPLCSVNPFLQLIDVVIRVTNQGDCKKVSVHNIQTYTKQTGEV